MYQSPKQRALQKPAVKQAVSTRTNSTVRLMIDRVLSFPGELAYFVQIIPNDNSGAIYQHSYRYNARDALAAFRAYL